MRRCLTDRHFALVLARVRFRAGAQKRAAWRGFGDAAQLEPNLHEWDYGDYEGRTTDQIRKEIPDWSIWNSEPPHGETIDQVYARAQAVIDRAASSDGDVASSSPMVIFFGF